MKEFLLELMEMESKEKKDEREHKAAERARQCEKDIRCFCQLAEIFGKQFNKSQTN
ncbi:hypothetical protein PF005_g1313 [Phytophthora fragariae]|uniref:Uncharacterized protein n=1 Tax=Phytophthora fragariae TaxID=53985 RepID=A0A6A3ZFD8_9STRA|nr:hypothetical protein PF009_g1339 [Phytophthora fragariae]KAE9138786.1 hypothetical protein PF007_g1241 [Phytophthora fragariae]KAE9154953.1 hypothetical protein PF006_g1046 [Phytophthora fragariae]KAE9235773.1 hypothetical protein PF005_g1313 [Phytophthora fragariae]KAE9254535.1 hypothetical protein PF004_g965 [Phytophthora fragariae]